MALRHAILSALLDREASGYELARIFEPTGNYFWHCAPQQLYAELTRLEGEGLTSGREVVQERRPNKRVFTLTGAGRDELARFVATESKPSFIRDDLLVKVQSADVGDTASLAAQLDERAAQARTRIAHFERRLGDLRGTRTEEEFLSSGEPLGPYLAARRGLAFERENLSWCVWSAGILRARADRP